MFNIFRNQKVCSSRLLELTHILLELGYQCTDDRWVLKSTQSEFRKRASHCLWLFASVISKRGDLFCCSYMRTSQSISRYEAFQEPRTVIAHRQSPWPSKRCVLDSLPSEDSPKPSDADLDEKRPNFPRSRACSLSSLCNSNKDPDQPLRTRSPLLSEQKDTAEREFTKSTDPTQQENASPCQLLHDIRISVDSSHGRKSLPDCDSYVYV